MGPGCASGFMRWRQFKAVDAKPGLGLTLCSIVLTGLLLKGSKSVSELSFIKMAKMERSAFPDKSAYLDSALSPSTGKHSQGGRLWRTAKYLQVHA